MSLKLKKKYVLKTKKLNNKNLMLINYNSCKLMMKKK